MSPVIIIIIVHYYVPALSTDEMIWNCPFTDSKKNMVFYNLQNLEFILNQKWRDSLKEIYPNIIIIEIQFNLYFESDTL